MKRVLHISDLSFGRIQTPALMALELFIRNQTPRIDLMVMTGEYPPSPIHAKRKAGAEFIRHCAFPVVAASQKYPPQFQILSKIFQPLRVKNSIFRRMVSRDYFDDEIAVVAFRSNGVGFLANEKYLEEDLAHAEKIFSQAGPRVFRMISSYYPMFQPKSLSQIRPRRLARDLLSLNAHLILSAHDHLNWIELVETANNMQSLHVSSGTAFLEYRFTEVNSFHIIGIFEKTVKVETYYLEDTGKITLKGVITHSFGAELPKFAGGQL